MDRIIRATAGDGAIKMAVINARDTVERARQIHGCAPTACAALGRTLCAASLMGQDMKEENAALTIRINGGGPLGGIVAVSDCEGNVRGYVGNPATELPLRSDGKLNVGAAVGRDGMFTVSRDIGLREPYVGSTELVSGEIAEDLSAYLVESEQIPAACGLGVLVDRDRSVLAAGGYLIQLLPGAGEDAIAKVEGGIYAAPSVTNQLRDDPDPANLLRTVLSDFDLEILETMPIEYRCYCSRGRTERALLSLGSKDLEDILREQGKADLTCQFCDRIHSFSGEELRRMIDELKKIGK